MQTLAAPLARGRDDPIALTVSELDLFLDGSTVVGRVVLSPPAMTHFWLASDRE